LVYIDPYGEFPWAILAAFAGAYWGGLAVNEFEPNPLKWKSNITTYFSMAAGAFGGGYLASTAMQTGVTLAAFGYPLYQLGGHKNSLSSFDDPIPDTPEVPISPDDENGTPENLDYLGGSGGYGPTTPNGYGANMRFVRYSNGRAYSSWGGRAFSSGAEALYGLARAFIYNEHWYQTKHRVNVPRTDGLGGVRHWVSKGRFFNRAATRGGVWGGPISGGLEYMRGGSWEDVAWATGRGTVSGMGGALSGATAGTMIGGPAGTILGFGVGFTVSYASDWWLERQINNFRINR
jgi:hypothetical protein